MYRITRAEKLADRIFLVDVHAPHVTHACLPGEFVIVRAEEEGERIPLTICDYNRETGTVTLVIQIVGAATMKMSRVKAGDEWCDVVGPLGNPSEFVHEDLEKLKQKKYIFIGGGLGTAPIYPQVKWFREHGMEADVIIGAKTEDLLILRDEMEKAAGHVYYATDDGSFGYHGLVTGLLEDLIEKEGKHYDVCVAIGPAIMMKFVCLATEKLGIHTIVSMNPIMVDGTGMCGACRLTVGGETKFACVDGPEFDGHLIDWDGALKRQRQYKTEEGRAMLALQEGDTHHGGCGHCGGNH